MHRIWNSVVRPLAARVEPKTMLEIGAEGGNGTKALLKFVDKHDGVLHCIDPAPAFDPESVATEFPDRLVFHRALSLDVIPNLPRFDVGLIDGDHNWYTVYHELRLIEKLHGGDASEFPLLFVHDVGWPYGRRDLYYDPETIPAEFRQPHAREGILPNSVELQPGRGLNRQLHNATHSGGARNGVFTGVEDFVGQSALSFRLEVLPIFFGLAILATHARLESNPRLARGLDELRSPAGLLRLCELNEHIRCVDNIILQTIKQQLDTLKETTEAAGGRNR